MRLAFTLIAAAAFLTIPALLIGGFNGLTLLGCLAVVAAIALTIIGAPSHTRRRNTKETHS